MDRYAPQRADYVPMVATTLDFQEDVLWIKIWPPHWDFNYSEEHNRRRDERNDSAALRPSEPSDAQGS